MSTHADSSRTRSIWRAALILFLAVSMALPAFAEEEARAQHKDDREKAVLRSLFQSLTPLEPIQIGPLTVVPLQASPDMAAVSVSGHPTLLTSAVESADPRKPTLRLTNPTSRAVLVTAGRVAYAGKAEVVLAHDVVVPAKGSATARALPISFARGALKEGQSLEWYARWAPPSLRETIVTDATSYDVKQYLSLFHAVAGNGRNKIPSLRQVLGSPFAGQLDSQVAQVMHEERFRAKNVVGFVSGLNGRAITFQLFGSSELHRKNAGALLESHGIYAGALAARAEALNMQKHVGAEAARAVLEDTRDMLFILRSKSRKQPQQLDGITGIDGPGLMGRAIWHDGQPVHVAVYPFNPYERYLFARSFQAPKPAAD